MRSCSGTSGRSTCPECLACPKGTTNRRAESQEACPEYVITEIGAPAIARMQAMLANSEACR